MGGASISKWTTLSRGKILNMMRGAAAAVDCTKSIYALRTIFPDGSADLNDNAAAFKDTVEGVIEILQQYDQRTASQLSPSIAVQFYEHMQTELVTYQTSGQKLGLDLASRTSIALSKNPLTCPREEAQLKADLAQLVTALTNNYPTLATANFLLARPLCFPNKSPGQLEFVPTDTTQQWTVLQGPLVIANAGSNNNNLKVDLEYTAATNMNPTGNLLAPCYLIPRLNAWAYTSHIQLDFDCVTRQLSITGLNNPSCAVVEVPGSNGQQFEQFCGPSAATVSSCTGVVIPNGLESEDEMFWHPIPG
ncbi:hypothetical protein B0H13DRAFT_1853965 [Mycena leptocephala]|nr:hypothetical protein B0H13DRAFT_1853965 [Mycena leptocephala]